MSSRNSWDSWVNEALTKLDSLNLVRSLRPISFPISLSQQNLDTFDDLQPWDRSSVEIQIDESTFHNWLHNVHSSGDEIMFPDDSGDVKLDLAPRPKRKLILFSGNDYIGLSSHPTVRKAVAETAQRHGMGPRGSALICGYTSYHRLLESCLADLKKKEDCLLCPTGFAANMALMVTIGSVSSLLSASKKPSKDEKVAIFSDALNHASIIDGIRLAERQQEVEIFVYRHCDMVHLNTLLSRCTMEKKVVVTDSLFSMDGDFAPLLELAKLRKKHGFLLVIDDAHGTLVCGENGGGVAEEFNCESDIDICIGTLSKAAGCSGGFIACNKKWKQLLQSRGRSFIFSTSLPLPIAAAAYAAIVVGKKEKWRRRAIWKRVQDFRDLTQIPITSPIISLVVGSEVNALKASKHLLESGFHVTAIRPPTVPANSCRLRITLCAAHTRDDIDKLTCALSSCISFKEIGVENVERHARL
ncbi:8-amino-7-oxononanoate synthase [Ranunculus cassubicifolius]